MPATRNWSARLRRPVFLLALAVVGTQVVVETLLKYGTLSARARSVAGFLPAIVWVFFIVAFVREVRKKDELQRLLHLQATSYAFGLTVFLALVFSGLETAGVYHAPWFQVELPAMGLWAIAYLVLARKYPC